MAALVASGDKWRGRDGFEARIRSQSSNAGKHINDTIPPGAIG
jgi:hypothetical protein